jgi:hypothetical protein
MPRERKNLSQAKCNQPAIVLQPHLKPKIFSSSVVQKLAGVRGTPDGAHRSFTPKEGFVAGSM